MKEIKGYICWLWRRQETWQKWWIVAMFFLGAGWGAEGMARNILWAIPLSIFLFYGLKWAIWDSVRSSWRNYKEHRNQLLTTIKNSDQ